MQDRECRGATIRMEQRQMRARRQPAARATAPTLSLGIDSLQRQKRFRRNTKSTQIGKITKYYDNEEQSDCSRVVLLVDHFVFSVDPCVLCVNASYSSSFGTI